MRVVTPSVELMRTGLEKDFMTPEQFIEKVGRTCYKSEDKITEDSAAKFVSSLIKRAHEAMIEHWSLIFRFTNHAEYITFIDTKNCIEEYAGIRPHLRVTDRTDDGENWSGVVSGNMRAWRDYIKLCINETTNIPRQLHGIISAYPLFFPEYIGMIENDTEPYYALIPITVADLDDYERKVHQDVTFKFVCDRGVSHEIVRHRTSSFAQESTRYCNYSGEKFDKCITVVEPKFIGDAYLNGKHDIILSWERACANAEREYFELLDMGCTPQEARSVLPNSLKTEIIMTTNLNGWEHFFNLRCAPDAHPDIQVVANMAKELYDAYI